MRAAAETGLQTWIGGNLNCAVGLTCCHVRGAGKVGISQCTDQKDVGRLLFMAFCSSFFLPQQQCTEALAVEVYMESNTE